MKGQVNVGRPEVHSRVTNMLRDVPGDSLIVGRISVRLFTSRPKRSTECHDVPVPAACRRRGRLRIRHRTDQTEHRLHLLRRPRLPGDQRLRRPAQAARDAEHRPHREGGDAVRPLPRAELHLRPEPGHASSPASTATSTASTTTPTAASTARRSRSRSCSRRPATRPRSSASGTSSATRPASTTGTSCRARASTTTRR